MEGVYVKYKVGDQLWQARCKWLPVKKTCPICFGNKEVTLILGNEDRVILPCDYCGKGFDVPSGLVSEYEYVVEPELITVTSVEVSITDDKTFVEYRSGQFRLKEELLFDSEVDAIAKGSELKAKLEKEQQTKASHIKHDVNKTYSWNAGYHMRQAKRERQSAEYHEKKAVLCKTKEQKRGK